MTVVQRTANQLRNVSYRRVISHICNITKECIVVLHRVWATDSKLFYETISIICM